MKGWGGGGGAGGAERGLKMYVFLSDSSEAVRKRVKSVGLCFIYARRNELLAGFLVALQII